MIQPFQKKSTSGVGKVASLIASIYTGGAAGGAMNMLSSNNAAIGGASAAASKSATGGGGPGGVNGGILAKKDPNENWGFSGGALSRRMDGGAAQSQAFASDESADPGYEPNYGSALYRRYKGYG